VILIDTGPLVALVDPRDRLHRTARQHLERLAAPGLTTCEGVIAESCFLLPRPAERRRLQAVLDAFGIAPLESGLGMWTEVFAWLMKYAEHDPDWTDGCIAVWSGRDARLKVWTYDREFRTTWRRPNGSAIPLAVR
jgi:hypothetical protein